MLHFQSCRTNQYVGDMLAIAIDKEPKGSFTIIKGQDVNVHIAVCAEKCPLALDILSKAHSFQTIHDKDQELLL